MAGLGFERPQAAFFLALIPAMGTLFEFAPGRIDYHNVQIVFLLAAIALTLMRSAGAAMVSGAIIALALATSTRVRVVLRPRDGDPCGRVRQRLTKEAACGWERSAPRWP